MKLTHNEPGLGLRVATHVAYANPSVPQPYALLATDAAHREFIAQDQLYIARDAMPPHDLDLLTKGAERLKTRAVRKRVPGYKSSASVGFPDIMALAPEIAALYKSPSLVAALSQLAGARLEPCPDRDPHACALYYYTEAGDRIGWHFDSSHYRGTRYTVLIGLVNQTAESRLRCELFKKDATREAVRLDVSTDPGVLVFFNGDRLWHSVSPVGPDEERIVLTLEYVTDPYMHPIRRLVSDFKDASTYFGFFRKPR